MSGGDAGAVRTFLLLVISCWAVLPAPVAGWGMDVHRGITARALEGLPAAPRDFFGRDRAFIAEHSVDPDLWRVVHLAGPMGPEGPNHFLDIDALDEPAPFRQVPRDRQAFLARYGAARSEAAGRLPWRVTEVFDLLVDAIAHIGDRAHPYAAANASYLAAVLAHYIEDAFVPFHAIANFDGQLTGQAGAHARFETTLPLQFADRLSLQPVAIRDVPDVREFIFEALTEGARVSAVVLDADRAAASRHPAWDGAAFEAYFGLVQPVLERRLAEAANGVASVLSTAWDRAQRQRAGPAGAPASTGP